MQKTPQRIKSRKKTLRRLSGLALAIAMAAGICSPAAAATARATTMKLESTTGRVTLKTQSGTARKITKGMRLYNGNSIETAAYSCAYISLDSSKAAKLDASSKAALKQKGKQLELLVKSGKLFFNVKTPLSGKESMNVRTSTMVTGVRGTCGVVESAGGASTLYLLEGQVELKSTDPLTGEQETVIVTGGHMATVSRIPGSAAGTEAHIVVEQMEEEEVPLFAIEEVMKDPQLQEKIERLSDLEVDKMGAYLEAQLQGDPAGGDSMDDSNVPGGSQPDTNNGNTAGGDPGTNGPSGSGAVIDKPGTGSDRPQDPSGGDNSQGGTSTPSVPTEPSRPTGPSDTGQPSGGDPGGDRPQDDPEAPYGTPTVLDGAVSLADIQQAWKTCRAVKLTGKADLGVGTDSLQITSGSALIIAEGADITVRGSLTVDGYLKNDGIFQLEQGMDGSGKFSNGDNGVLTAPYDVDVKEKVGIYLAQCGTKRYYASCLNKNLAEIINASAGADTWVFGKDVVVPQGQEVTLDRFCANMESSEIQVKGSLIFRDLQMLSGRGRAVVHMMGGTLRLAQATADTGTALNRTITCLGTAIAVDDAGKGGIIWEDTGLNITARTTAECIQGIVTEDSTGVKWKEDYLTIDKTKYTISYDTVKNQIYLKGIGQ